MSNDGHNPSDPRPGAGREPGPESAGAVDARDEHVAALLAVEPLDELTRRRLVRTAVDAAPAPRRRRRAPGWWVGAAAAVVVAVIAGAVALTGSGPGERQTAEPKTLAPSSLVPSTTPTLVPSGAAPEQPEAADRATAAPKQLFVPASGASALGDLGDVTRPADLRSSAKRALQSLESAFASNSPTTGVPTELQLGGAKATTGSGCGAALTTAHPDLRSIVAIGSGTVHGKPATVLVATDASGARVAVAITDAGCTVGRLVTVTP